MSNWTKAKQRPSLRDYCHEQKITRLIRFLHSNSPSSHIPEPSTRKETPIRVQQSTNLNDAINSYLKSKASSSPTSSRNALINPSHVKKHNKSERVKSQQSEVMFPTLKPIQTQGSSYSKSLERQNGNR